MLSSSHHTGLNVWRTTLENDSERVAITWFLSNQVKNISYQELEQRSNDLARILREKHNISPIEDHNQLELKEPIIGIYCDRGSPLWIVGILAGWKTGAALLLLDKTLGTCEVIYRAHNARVRCILTDVCDINSDIEAAFSHCLITYDLNNFHESSLPFNYERAIPQDYLAYVTYTSGSTGQAKAIALNHSGIVGLIKAHREFMQLNRDDKIAQISSLNFDPCWMNFFLLISGTSCALWTPSLGGISSYAPFFNDNQITTSIFVPSFLKELEPTQFKTLKNILTTGESASPVLLNAWKNSIPLARRIIIGYGPSEDTVGSTLHVYQEDSPFCIGTSFTGRGFELSQIDLESPEMPKEILLTGEGLARGYITDGKIDKELTDKHFFYNAAPAASSIPLRYYRTGDLALSSEHGLLFKGRLDRQIKFFGRRIELGGIEAVYTKLLQEMGFVTGTIHAVAKYQMNEGEKIFTDIIAIILYDQQDPNLTQLDIQRKISEEGLSVERPSRWYWINKTAIAELELIQDSDKFNIRKCQEFINIPDHPIHHLLEPLVFCHECCELEKFCELDIIILNLIRDLLLLPGSMPLTQIAKYSFEELGGNSISSERLVNQIKNKFSVEIKINSNATLSDLVTAITYTLIMPMCLTTISNSKFEHSLFCFPPVSGHPGHYKKYLAESIRHAKEFKLNLQTFMMPQLLSLNKAASSNLGMLIESFEKYQLWGNLDAIAEYIFFAMQQSQPHGPYFIVGYSWGSHLAYAIANVILNKNQDLAWLGLLDGIPPGFLNINLADGFDILIRDIWPNVLCVIAKSCGCELEPINEIIAGGSSDYERLELFFTITMRQIQEKKYSVIKAELSTQNSIEETHENLTKTIQSCFYNMLASVKTHSERLPILNNKNTLVSLFSTKTEHSACMRTSPDAWNDRFTGAIEKISLSCSHLQILQNKGFHQALIEILAPVIQKAMAEPSTETLKTRVVILEREIASIKMRSQPVTDTSSQKSIPAMTLLSCNPPRPNINFIGRETLLVQIENRLKRPVEDGHVTLTVCHGLGGVGKTQLVLAYIKKYRKNYQQIFWFPASNAEYIKSSFVSLANELNLKQEDDMPEMVIPRVINYLESTTNSLLIFDNAPDYETIEPYFPNQGGHFVLATSRFANWPNEEMGIAVNVFNKEESRAYIQKIIGISELLEELDALSDMLGHLPLALAQACGFIKEMRRQGMTIQGYLGKYQKNKIGLLSHEKFPSIHDKYEAVYITWDITMQFIRETSPLALKISNFSAFVNNDNIVEILYQTLANNELINPDREDLDEALALLCNFHILSYDWVSRVYSMHILVHEVLFAKLIPECISEEKVLEMEQHIELVNTLLIQNYPYCIENSIPLDTLDDIAKKCSLLPHLEEFLSKLKLFLSKTFDKKSLYKKIDFIMVLLADGYKNTGNYDRQLAVQREILTIVQLHYDDLNDPGIGNRLMNLGASLVAHGKPREALVSLNQALAFFEKDRNGAASCLANIGGCHIALKEYELAREVSSQAAAKFVGDFIDENYDIASEPSENTIEMHGLYVIPHGRGLGLRAFHHNARIAFINLARAYEGLGYISESKKAFEMALTLTQNSYSPDHPELAMLNLHSSGLLHKKGDLSAEKNLLETALPILQTHYPINHPAVSVTLMKLSAAEIGSFNPHGAVAHLKQALEIEKKQQGDRHPDVASILANLGQAYAQLGQYELALTCEENALSIFKEHSENNEHNIANVLANLGDLFGELGNAERKMELVSEALKIQRRLDGDMHPSIAHRLISLGEGHRKLGNLIEQFKVTKEAYVILKNHYNDEHIEVLSALFSLSNAHQSLGETKEQKEFLEFIIPKIETAIGCDNTLFGMACTNLGSVYLILDKNATARDLLIKSSNILKKLTPGHPNLGIAFMQLGYAEIKLTNIIKGKKHLEEAHKIFLNYPAYSSNQSTIQTILNELSMHDDRTPQISEEDKTESCAFYCACGLLLLSQSKIELAIEAFRRSISLGIDGLKLDFAEVLSRIPDSCIAQFQSEYHSENGLEPYFLAYYGLIQCYIKSEVAESPECQQALAEFWKALGENQVSGFYWKLLSYTYRNLHQQELADECACFALSLSETDEERISKPSFSRAEAGPASPTFFVDKTERTANDHIRAGIQHKKAGNIDEWNRCIEMALLIEPNITTACYEKAEFLFLKNQHINALAVLDRGLGNESNEESKSRSYMLKSYILVHLGKLDLAMEMLLKISQCDSEAAYEKQNLINFILELQEQKNNYMINLAEFIPEKLLHNRRMG